MLIFRLHARIRMVERRITQQPVEAILATGETIEDYPEAFPYPARLLLGWFEERALHVVVAEHASEGISIIVTVYEPDEGEWLPGYRRRREAP